MEPRLFSVRRFQGSWRGLDPILKTRVIDVAISLPTLVARLRSAVPAHIIRLRNENQSAQMNEHYVGHVRHYLT
jgi:hypothetical protein